MCGIFGVAALDGSVPRAERLAVTHGSRAIAHRGPDGEGTWGDDSVEFGHRRLAIIDLSETGRQPMESASGRYVIAFNGEIYNFRELGSRLMASGWSPRGSSDTEVLLAAIEAWGVDRTLERADGMFALSLYDRSERRLHLARDRFGEKPLHVCRSGRLLWFGSELKSFESITGRSLDVNIESAEAYFRLGYVPGNRTIFCDVERLGPAEHAVWDLSTGKEQRRQFWSPSPRTAVDDEELLALLTSSITTRLIADRPVGAFLSGGVDSSLICAIAAQASNRPLRTFTMAWADREYDESEQAAIVARSIGADHTEIRLGRAETVEAVSQLGSVLDEPFGDSSLLPTYLVARETRRHVVVALSGDGGDELFAGYNRHRWLPRVARLDRIPRPVRRALAGTLWSMSGSIETALRPLPPRRRPRLVADKVSKLARALAARDLLDAYQTTISIDAHSGRPVELDADTTEGLRATDPDRLLLALRMADLRGYLPDDVLTKVDRATMACSLESRAPFLQPDVVNAALGCGANNVFDSHGGKAPLRRLLRRLVPDVSFDASKMGFGMPVGSLLRGELRPTLGDAVERFTTRCSPVTIPWRDLLARLDRGDDAVQHRLWSLLAFELWAEGRRINWSHEART